MKNPILNKIRKIVETTLNIFSTIVICAIIIASVIAVIEVSIAKYKGEDAYFFGYKPIFVLTGSMEPYMETNGTVLVKKVNSIDEIAVDDVVSYHLTLEDGNEIRVTHRIISIEDGVIRTKGDNNKVNDTYPLTMENIDAKVVSVHNWTAILVEQWQTTTGKVFMVLFVLFIIFLYLTLKAMLSPTEEPVAVETVVVSEGVQGLTIYDMKLKVILEENRYTIKQLVTAIESGKIKLSDINKIEDEIEIEDEEETNE